MSTLYRMRIALSIALLVFASVGNAKIASASQAKLVSATITTKSPAGEDLKSISFIMLCPQVVITTYLYTTGKPMPVAGFAHDLYRTSLSHCLVLLNKNIGLAPPVDHALHKLTVKLALSFSDGLEIDVARPISVGDEAPVVFGLGPTVITDGTANIITGANQRDNAMSVRAGLDCGQTTVMSGLAAGGSNWLAGSSNSVRLDLAEVAGTPEDIASSCEFWISANFFDSMYWDIAGGTIDLRFDDGSSLTYSIPAALLSSPFKVSTRFAPHLGK